MKKRIGLLLASIHTGAALNVWNSFARLSAEEPGALFIFPGGRLNKRQDSEHLRNAVYALANAENLDGLICWGSTIRYDGSAVDFERFYAQFASLPLVSLCYKTPQHPCVEFDAYNGMKMLVNHFIQAHGVRRIAFLRGPDFHQSALSRVRGYEDAIREAGLRLNPLLVSDSFNWDSGAAAIVQLVAERGFLPGRDFDTLIGSSDLMLFEAVRYLAKRGYEMPRDYRAGGFNNSAESRLLTPPLSTVHLPYVELSAVSFRIMQSLLGRRWRQASVDDVLLPSQVMIRESCGCHNVPAIDTQAAMDTGLRERYEKEKWNEALNSLKCELLGIRTRRELALCLARHLGNIGIGTAAIVLFEDEQVSVCIGSFSPAGIALAQEERFPARQLVPSTLRHQYDDGVFMVQPLFTENQSLGYIIHNVPIHDGLILEELRSAVSYALKGILLMDEVVWAKRNAEQAEQAKTEYLRALEHEIYEPLSGIMEKIEALEKTLPALGPSTSLAFEQLKKLVASRERVFCPSHRADWSASPLLFIGDDTAAWPVLAGDSEVIHIATMERFTRTIAEITPLFIVVYGLDVAAIAEIRRHPRTLMAPVVLIADHIKTPEVIMDLCHYSRLLICNSAVATSPEFVSRFRALGSGAEILPPHTGAFVKKAILYLNQNAKGFISRWKLADAVHVSEDYLSRVFHCEMGISLWDYLSRYRVFIAVDLLRHTDLSIQEVAFGAGFQDHAYFCRVFRKFYGMSPSCMRKTTPGDG
ncbi:MAG: helix-turn-helix domain-containing protein [Treponema sp.]|nr:helix-turn-helix domain-containing protein [Treponema sp.]